ncbi:MAG: signal peptide peptidase SppA [Persephonella sp.]|nr:MAG: signal peptide peptidase SppA [Persephonella sp.]RUM60855.1 MAG: signal peptide peptidase SppA [Persephonella sp.]
MKKIVIAILGILAFLIFIVVVLRFVEANTQKIAVIYVNGVISDYVPYVKKISTARKNKSIKAVVLVVDSPGGAVGSSQEIYRALEKLRKEKPLVVSMGNVAASGGYYISVPANVIYANPGTITGSIGVIIQHVNVKSLLNKVGVKVENIKSGKNKDILYPNNDLTDEQKKLLEDTIKDVYDQFLDAIVKYRPIRKEKLRKYADGRIFSGRQALKLGLVDKLGNVQDALEEARKLANLKKGQYQIIELTDDKGFLDKLLGSDLGEKINNLLNIQNTGIYYLTSF